MSWYTNLIKVINNVQKYLSFHRFFFLQKKAFMQPSFSSPMPHCPKIIYTMTVYNQFCSSYFIIMTFCIFLSFPFFTIHRLLVSGIISWTIFRLGCNQMLHKNVLILSFELIINNVAFAFFFARLRRYIVAASFHYRISHHVDPCLVICTKSITV